MKENTESFKNQNDFLRQESHRKNRWHSLKKWKSGIREKGRAKIRLTVAVNFFSCPLSLLQVIIDVSVRFTYELEDSSCSWKDAACSFLPGFSWSSELLFGLPICCFVPEADQIALTLETLHRNFLQMVLNNKVFAHWFLGSFSFEVKVQPNWPLGRKQIRQKMVSL